MTCRHPSTQTCDECGWVLDKTAEPQNPITVCQTCGVDSFQHGPGCMSADIVSFRTEKKFIEYEERIKVLNAEVNAWRDWSAYSGHQPTSGSKSAKAVRSARRRTDLMRKT